MRRPLMTRNGRGVMSDLSVRWGSKTDRDGFGSERATANKGPVARLFVVLGIDRVVSPRVAHAFAPDVFGAVMVSSIDRIARSERARRNFRRVLLADAGGRIDALCGLAGAELPHPLL
jgi:hypothetical protein